MAEVCPSKRPTSITSNSFRHSRGFQRAVAFAGHDPTRLEDLDLRKDSMGIPPRAGWFIWMDFQRKLHGFNKINHPDGFVVVV
jgi:hypothetical protein